MLGCHNYCYWPPALSILVVFTLITVWPHLLVLAHCCTWVFCIIFRTDAFPLIIVITTVWHKQNIELKTIEFYILLSTSGSFSFLTEKARYLKSIKVGRWKKCKLKHLSVVHPDINIRMHPQTMLRMHHCLTVLFICYISRQ